MANRKSRTGKPAKRRARRSPAVAVRTKQREEEIVSRRLRGQTYSVIADAMGMSISATHEAFWRCLNEIPVKAVEQLRLESLARIEMLRTMVWRTEKRGRLSARNVALLLALEDRQCKLMGLDAADKYDPTAIPVATPDRDAQVAQLQRNLSPEELRQLTALMRKGAGIGAGDRAAIETTSTPTPAASPDTTARAMVVAETDRPQQTMSGFVAQTVEVEPEPSRSYRDPATFAAETNTHPEDPAFMQYLAVAERRWSLWHLRNCDRDPAHCRHFDPPKDESR